MATLGLVAVVVGFIVSDSAGGGIGIGPDSEVCDHRIEVVVMVVAEAVAMVTVMLSHSGTTSNCHSCSS